MSLANRIPSILGLIVRKSSDDPVRTTPTCKRSLPTSELVRNLKLNFGTKSSPGNQEAHITPKPYRYAKTNMPIFGPLKVSAGLLKDERAEAQKLDYKMTHFFAKLGNASGRLIAHLCFLSPAPSLAQTINLRGRFPLTHRKLMTLPARGGDASMWVMPLETCWNLPASFPMSFLLISLVGPPSRLRSFPPLICLPLANMALLLPVAWMVGRLMTGPVYRLMPWRK